jgi:hypothetical protein
MEASSAAASRLWAAVTAWKSPLKWRLISSIGTTWAYPPPLPPPLIPNTGPMEGSRRHSMTSLPILPRPWAREMDVVVFPSPAFVGVMAVVMMSLPSGDSARRSRTPSETFARCRPWSSISSSRSPARAAISWMGDSTASWAISSPLFMGRATSSSWI